MVLKLYKADASPPARASMMVCELFNVPVELVDVNLAKGEHVTPEYLKKNPLHTIPLLEDGVLILHDSHAIITYLADQYAKEHSFYPKDVKQRALVNQKLFFNSSVLFPRLTNITKPLFMEGVKTVSEKQLKAIEEAYGFLEQFLTRSNYIAGNNVTLADIAAYATVTSLDLLKKVDPNRYPKISAWINVMGRQPYAQKNAGVKVLKSMLDSALA